MDKEILKKVLNELTEILERTEWMKEIHALKPRETPKQDYRAFNTTSNAVKRKYKVITDLIDKI